MARTVPIHVAACLRPSSGTRRDQWPSRPWHSAPSEEEAQDLALIAHAATLRARLPFLHFFDGFRTSHEVATIEQVDEDVIRSMIDQDAVADHRTRALHPARPVLRGTAQNPDVFFQAREASNPYYLAVPDLVQAEMDRFASLAGYLPELDGYNTGPEHNVELLRRAKRELRVPARPEAA